MLYGGEAPQRLGPATLSQQIHLRDDALLGIFGSFCIDNGADEATTLKAYVKPGAFARIGGERTPGGITFDSIGAVVADSTRRVHQSCIQLYVDMTCLMIY